MCLQKWFQRKMWNYDKVNNSRSWIFCISITLIKCETVNLFLFSLNTLPNKKIMHCCLTGKNMIHSSIGYLCHILYKWYKQLYFLIHNHSYANMTNGICLDIHHNTRKNYTPSPCRFSHCPQIKHLASRKCFTFNLHYQCKILDRSYLTSNFNIDIHVDF
jgi:hypothetical protein